MTDEYLNFNSGKINLDDFSFNINNDASSTIPENELLDFTTGNPNNNNINNSHNLHQGSHGTTHLNPTQLHSGSLTHNDPSNVQNSFHNNSYLSPVNSPYTNPNHLSTSFVSSRKNSVYDTLESVASPQQHQSTLNSQYFSPSQKPMSFSNNTASRQIPDISSINSPGSINDQLSPYPSSFDTFKSPSVRSQGLSPATSSGPKQQLTKEDKLRRRREFHNQVERRRRDLIKERIKELGVIVPPSLLLVDSDGKEIKPSKSVIIYKTVEYLIHLHKVMKSQDERLADLIAKIEELEKLPDQNPVPQGNNENSYQNSPANIQTFGSDNQQHELDFDVNEFLKDHKTDANWDGLNI